MRYRLTELQASKTLSTTADTLTVDVRTQHPISALQFEYKATRASNTETAHVLANLEKIELVDGSDVLFSLSGKEMHALDYFNTKQSPYTYVTNAIGVMSMASPRYWFGTRLWDPNYAWDPTRFKNPQLVITYDPTKFDASATVHVIKVLAYMFDEFAPNPKGFLSSREVTSYTSPANTVDEDTLLVTTQTLRKLLLFGTASGYDLYQVINNVKLLENSDTPIPIDEAVSTLMKEVNGNFPEFVEYLYAVLTAAASSHYVSPYYDVKAMVSADAGAGYGGAAVPNNQSPISITGSGNFNASCLISGFNPHGAMPILFGNQDDDMDWYDVTKLKSLLLRLTAGSAGTNGTVKVVSESVRPY